MQSREQNVEFQWIWYYFRISETEIGPDRVAVTAVVVLLSIRSNSATYNGGGREREGKWPPQPSRRIGLACPGIEWMDPEK